MIESRRLFMALGFYGSLKGPGRTQQVESRADDLRVGALPLQRRVEAGPQDVCLCQIALNYDVLLGGSLQLLASKHSAWEITT